MFDGGGRADAGSVGCGCAGPGPLPGVFGSVVVGRTVVLVLTPSCVVTGTSPPSTGEVEGEPLSNPGFSTSTTGSSVATAAAEVVAPGTSTTTVVGVKSFKLFVSVTSGPWMPPASISTPFKLPLGEGVPVGKAVPPILRPPPWEEEVDDCEIFTSTDVVVEIEGGEVVGTLTFSVVDVKESDEKV